MCNLCNRIITRKLLAKKNKDQLKDTQLNKLFPLNDKYCSFIRRQGNLLVVKPNPVYLAQVTNILAYHSLI